MIRIAILGAGEIAVRHVEGFQRTRDVKLVSICDPIAERATELAESADFERVDAHADDAITADDIDLVLVLTPHDLHAPQVVAALEAGKHVVIEKPFTGAFTPGRDARGWEKCLEEGLESADRMIAAEQKSGRYIMYAENLIYAPGVQKARRLLDAADTPILRIVGEE